jgi:hypothetical protein
MTVDSAATFFVASILVGFGVITITGVLLLVNNLFSRFWRPIKWNVYMPFIPIEEPKLEPTVNTANTEVQSAGR